MGNGENIGGSLLIMRLMPYGHWQRIEEIKQERKIMLKEGINEEKRANPSSKRHAKSRVCQR